MFRLWARTFQNNHMLNDTVICDDREETRTHKVFDALQEVEKRAALSAAPASLSWL